MPRIWMLLTCLLASCPAIAAGDLDCRDRVARWLDPASGETLAIPDVFARLERASVVLLGESHTTLAHHRWQAAVLAGLHARKPDMAIGFEMLPRSAQPALDAWSAGELGEKAFLDRVDWQRVWGYDAGLYLPLLHFARMHRLPTIALNVERALVSKVGRSGWDAVPPAEREGVSTPAPARAAYRRSLAELYALKRQLGAEQEGREVAAEDLDIDAILESVEFTRFVDAQLTWDRAMAEALAAAHRRNPDSTVVGIVGRGHLEHGHGIPRQLAALGVERVETLLPHDADESCADLAADLADAIFVVDADGEAETPPRPRLGVLIEDGDGGVRVTEVFADSVAARSGVEAGDLIVSAAGFATVNTGELIEIIGRQAPGTWLPLGVRRGARNLDLTAKFPQSFE